MHLATTETIRRAAHGQSVTQMMMIAFIAINSGIVPLIVGLCAQILIIKDLRLLVVCVPVSCSLRYDKKRSQLTPTQNLGRGARRQRALARRLRAPTGSRTMQIEEHDTPLKDKVMTLPSEDLRAWKSTLLPHFLQNLCYIQSNTDVKKLQTSLNLSLTRALYVYGDHTSLLADIGDHY